MRCNFPNKLDTVFWERHFPENFPKINVNSKERPV